MDIVVYKTATGIITKLLTLDQADVDYNIETDESYIVHNISEVSLKTNYVTSGEVEVKPYLSSVASWDKAGVDATGSDTATLSGLPNPSTVTINPLDATVAYLEDHDVTDGTAAFTTTVEGVFKVTAKSEGYLDYIEHISSGNTVGVSLLTVFCDTDSVNVPDTFLVDLLTVGVSTNDVDFTSNDLLTVDLQTVSVTTNDIESRNVDIVQVDLVRVNTTTRYPYINAGETVEVDLVTVTSTTNEITQNTVDRVEVDTVAVTVNTYTVDVYPDIVYVDTATVYVTAKDPIV